MAFVNEREQRRTIDHERDIVFTHESTNRENYSFFKLIWDKKIFEICAVKKTKLHDDGTSTINWHIDSLKAPKNLNINGSELFSIINEALDVYGVSYGKINVKEINVDVNPEISSLSLEK